MHPDHDEFGLLDTIVADKYRIEKVVGSGGFGVFFVEPTRSRVHHYPVVCDGGVAIVEGKRYERAKVLPTGGAALARWWTDRMGLDRGAYL